MFHYLGQSPPLPGQRSLHPDRRPRQRHSIQGGIGGRFAGSGIGGQNLLHQRGNGRLLGGRGGGDGKLKLIYQIDIRLVPE